MKEIELLRVELNQLMPEGQTMNGLPKRILPILQSVWPSLDGCDDTQMDAGKLSRATSEESSWNPPVLQIAVERHGGTVNGSIYGEVQQWRVDLDQLTAQYSILRKRQLHPSAPRLDLASLAAKFVQAVTQSLNDPCVKRLQDGRVGPSMKELLPVSAKQTYAGRSKRLRKLLDPLMEDAGWGKDGLYFKRKV